MSDTANRSHDDKIVITITVPPVGFLKSGSLMFVLFCIFWWGILAQHQVNPWGILAERQPNPFESLVQGPNANVIGFWLALALWLFGVPMLLFAWRLSRVSASLKVVGDLFLVRSSGVFWTMREDWHRRDLHDVHARLGHGFLVIPHVLPGHFLIHRRSEGEVIVNCFSPELEEFLAADPTMTGSLRVVTTDHKVHTILEGMPAERLVMITVALRKALGMT